MVLLPVLFFCLSSNSCYFDHGATSSSMEECLKQNIKVEQVLKANPQIVAFRTGCLDLTKPRKVETI